MSDLRDRIAAAIESIRIQRDGDAVQMADAVIAKLNLHTPVEYLSVDRKRKNFMLAGHYTVEVTE